MPERRAYEPVLSSKAAAFLIGLSKARQRKLIGLLYQLADSPSHIGDYSEPDDPGAKSNSFSCGISHCILGRPCCQGIEDCGYGSLDRAGLAVSVGVVGPDEQAFARSPWG